MRKFSLISCSKVLFPRDSQDVSQAEDEAVRRGGLNGQYELFTDVNLALQGQLTDMILNGTTGLSNTDTQ